MGRKAHSFCPRAFTPDKIQAPEKVENQRKHKLQGVLEHVAFFGF
jgi:hypothetical protein